MKYLKGICTAVITAVSIMVIASMATNGAAALTRLSDEQKGVHYERNSKGCYYNSHYYFKYNSYRCYYYYWHKYC